MEQDHPFIVGGDFNIILDHVLDGQGGNSKRKDSGKIVEDMDAELDLVDIWRIRNEYTFYLASKETNHTKAPRLLARKRY